MKRSAAFGVLRDASDLVPLLVGHYLRAGFDHVLIIDDGSTDGGSDILEKAAAQCGKLVVVRRDNPVFEQQQIINDAAASLLSEGYDLLVPFDADEFWMIDVPSLYRQIPKDGRAFAIHGRWTNFVQARDEHAAAAGFASVRYRVPDDDGATQSEVEALERGFVEVRLRKVAAYGAGPMVFSVGQHRLLQGPIESLPFTCEIFHLPLRRRAEIERRGRDFEARRLPIRSCESRSWQSRFFSETVQSGRVEAVWAANSASSRGCLDLKGGSRSLVPDPRFRLMEQAALRHFELLMQGAA